MEVRQLKTYVRDLGRGLGVRDFFEPRDLDLLSRDLDRTPLSYDFLEPDLDLLRDRLRDRLLLLRLGL